MNLEQLLNLAILNWSKIKKKKKVIQIIKNQYEILQKKKQKLKLGKIVFEVKELIYAEIPLMETLEIRYSRQDNTEADSMKLENRLEALKWKWDFYNIGAFIIVSLAFLSLFNYLFNIWMLQNMPAFALREVKYDKLVDFTFKSFKSSANLSYLPIWIKTANFALFDNISRYVIEKNIFF